MSALAHEPDAGVDVEARPWLRREFLERLYVHEGLSLKQVADRIGPPATKRIVHRALERHGIPLRPPKPPARKQESLSRELLEQLYVNEGRNLEEVAERTGVSLSTVKKRMEALGIERRKGAWRRVGDRRPLTRELLHRLRIVEQRHPSEIADALGYSEVQVRSALERHGIEARGRRSSLVDGLGAPELWWLHHHEGWPVHEIAARLRTQAERVSIRMKTLGVEIGERRRSGPPPRRPRGIRPPDHELIAEALDEAARRPRRLVTVVDPLDGASAEDLRRLHHDEGLALAAIGARYSVSPHRVLRRMEELGVEVRHRRGRRGVKVASQGEMERLSLLYDRPEILDALGRHRIAVRIDGRPILPAPDLTKGLLTDLYRDLQLPMKDVGLLTARSMSAVGRALRHHGLEVRRRLPTPPPAPSAGVQASLDPERLRRLAGRGMDAARIARLTGTRSPTTVRIVAQVLEIPLPGESGPLPVPKRVLAEIRRAGVSPDHAASVLDPRHLGVGAASGLTPWPWPPGPALLRHVYETLDIGLVELSDRLRCDIEELKNRLVSVGVRLRRPDDPHPSTRWRLDPVELRQLYVERGRTVPEIAEHLGVSRAVVYRALHRFHLPVVPGTGGEPRVRFDVPAGDPRVLSAMRAAGVALAGADPPIMSRPLSPRLLCVLVTDLGLSTFDIELLTGRLARSVLEDCRAAGIETLTRQAE